MDKKTVAVAMSGGVDSSLTAALLLEQGYEVLGITMLLTEEGRSETVDVAAGEEPDCVRDAKKVAEALGIRHYVADFRQEFRKNVIDYFLDEYAKGRTPNPCVMCNPSMKFGLLLDKAKELGADFLATGHYARIGQLDNGRYVVKKGLDEHKDQSYALHRLPQPILQHILLPLGDMTKEHVRELAENMDLPVAHKAESQEICFVPHDDYKAFLRKHKPGCLHKGNIVNDAGDVLGRHEGVPLYTIGQRKGLGIAAPEPLYVHKLDVKRNEVVVGGNKSVFATGLLASDPNWIAIDKLEDGMEFGAKIRYGKREAKAKLSLQADGLLKVEFAEPQRAVTPGQFVVFYEGDVLVGGAMIEQPLGAQEKTK
ncbi:putative tRNA-specific 2-thiouridylase MnmA [Selenomonas ruminantium subsp. lactilytica TAM6421]|uniref:tRNA-specific 2-thiouridylase MnmA n=1 Tax=Selenomonas ruminantium subsp. lactilytica (strain NBRC 103574 / TAM6421) TaxID=927704 RepID=I0GNZ8_SELRL|nr:tRNA 2-thiouridine(34) synthase MnmA [Selenomonas ruminantium]BAL82485.1 putative tRNA-specific 2-thiouridylase MnmA [Selenomonas ruminantium subsp. lactilytica TAM6421]